MSNYPKGYSLSLVTAPAAEPVDVADVQSRAGVSGDSALITALITATRQQVEIYLDRALITQTLRLVCRAFPYAAQLLLPRAPLQSVDTVAYFDIDDAEQTFAASKYIVLTDHTPGRIQVKYGQIWPTSVRYDAAVKVDYVAGYGDAATDVPEAIRQAILLATVDTYRRKRTELASERIDNVSQTFRDVPAGSGVSALPPHALAMLDPYKVTLL